MLYKTHLLLLICNILIEIIILIVYFLKAILNLVEEFHLLLLLAGWKVRSLSDLGTTCFRRSAHAPVGSWSLAGLTCSIDPKYAISRLLFIIQILGQITAALIIAIVKKHELTCVIFHRFFLILTYLAFGLWV